MQKYAFAVVVILAVAIAALVIRMQSTDETIAPPLAAGSNPHSQAGGTDASTSTHPPLSTVPETSLDLSGITIPEGGSDIATLYSRKSQFEGKRVIVRGKVVKFTAGVMGKNWVHIQDGTGSDGTNDLTITTDGTVEIGAVVVVEGVLSADMDYGFGYEYEIIVENATVTVD